MESSERLDSDITSSRCGWRIARKFGEQIAARRSRIAPHVQDARSGRKPLPPHLPREVVVHEPEILCVAAIAIRALKAGRDHHGGAGEDLQVKVMTCSSKYAGLCRGY